MASTTQCTELLPPEQLKGFVSALTPIKAATSKVHMFSAACAV